MIVPVYNSEQYLPKCIDSILSQTFTDFELILVNDGSKDGSGDICNNYAGIDYRVKVFHKVNGGVSKARNLGLENAKGEWIAFVDSDDTIDPAYLQNFLKHNLFPNELHIHGLNIWQNDMVKKSDISAHSTDKGAFKSLLASNIFLANGYPVAKLYSSQILNENKIQFKENVKINEDLIFMLEYSQYVDRISFHDIFDYNYYLWPGSAMRRIHKFEDEINGYRELKSIYKKTVGFEHITIQKSLGGYLYRAKLALYKLNYSRSKRLTFLESISDEDLNFMIVSSHNKVKKILLYLLKFDMIYTYDIILKGISRYIDKRNA